MYGSHTNNPHPHASVHRTNIQTLELMGKISLYKMRAVCCMLVQVSTWAVGAVPDFDVTFAYLNFRLKGFPVSDFQHGDGYTESQRLT